MSFLYNLLFLFSFVVSLPFLLVLAAFTQKMRQGLRQRFALYSREQVEGLRQREQPLWLHCASVGELKAAIPFLEAFRDHHPHIPFLISTNTLTAQSLAQNLGDKGGSSTLFFPLDLPWVCSRALKLARPRLVVIMETELWPNFLASCIEMKVPLFLLNGRVSDKSFPLYKRLAFLFAPFLRAFDGFFMQSQRDAERIRAMGARPEKIWVTGNTKYDSPMTSFKVKASLPFQGPHEGAQVLVAGSTHQGEEEALLEAFLSLRASFPHLILFLAPRHLERVKEVQKEATRLGLSPTLTSQWKGEPESLFIIDTMGQLPEYYQLAQVVFVGGSLVTRGGHNLLEPAALAKPILFGPHVNNFKDIAQNLLEEGAAFMIKDKEELRERLSFLLRNPGEAENMGKAALKVAQSQRGATQRVLSLMESLLDQRAME